MKWLLSQLCMVPWKKRYILKSFFLNLSSNCDENTLKLKLRVCTLSPNLVYNCNFNMFWSTAKLITIVSVFKYIWLWLKNHEPSCYMATVLSTKPQWSNFSYYNCLFLAMLDDHWELFIVLIAMDQHFPTRDFLIEGSAEALHVVVRVRQYR